MLTLPPVNATPITLSWEIPKCLSIKPRELHILCIWAASDCLDLQTYNRKQTATREVSFEENHTINISICQGEGWEEAHGGHISTLSSNGLVSSWGRVFLYSFIGLIDIYKVGILLLLFSKFMEHRGVLFSVFVSFFVFYKCYNCFFNPQFDFEIFP